MGYKDPKFPVVNDAPSVDDCLSVIRLSDYFTVAGIAAGTWSYGYIMGKPYRYPSASTAMTIGLTFAGMVVLQNTRGRLMGYKENAKEVQLLGSVEVKGDKHRPGLGKEINWRNYN